MGATVAHPTDQTLQAYGLGKLDDVTTESVSKHLEDCPSCQIRVAELSSDDFLRRLRVAQGSPEMPASNRLEVGGSNTDRGPAVAIAPPPAGTLPPGLADHPDYEIVRELGRGGMGVVYLARNKLMGRLEVLKVVGGHLVERPGVRDRFLREVQSAAKLQHRASRHPCSPCSGESVFRHPLPGQRRRPTILPGILRLPPFPTKKVGV